jgi:hypothetical protein
LAVPFAKRQGRAEILRRTMAMNRTSSRSSEAPAGRLLPDAALIKHDRKHNEFKMED